MVQEVDKKDLHARFFKEFFTVLLPTNSTLIVIRLCEEILTSYKNQEFIDVSDKNGTPDSLFFLLAFLTNFQNEFQTSDISFESSYMYRSI